MSETLHAKVWIACAIFLTQSECTNELQRDDESTKRDAASAASPAATTAVLEPVELIDQGHWREYPFDRDPLADHQPADVDCGPAGWYVEPAFEQPLLEVDTSYCNYALLEHPAAIEVAEGDTITFELRHYDLRAPEPAEAHIAWEFGDALEWETFVAIPSDAAVQTFEWRATHALRAGDPIRLHLHNHGQNTWQVGSLTARVAAAALGH
jgi:hypothetical protein